METVHTRIGGAGAIALINCVSVHSTSSRTAQWPHCEAEQQRTLVLLVPRGLPDPVEGEACICSDLDGRCLRLPDRLLDRLHQVLSVVHQHLGGLLGKSRREGKSEQGCRTGPGTGTLVERQRPTCSDSSSLMLVRPNMVALTVDRIFS